MEETIEKQRKLIAAFVGLVANPSDGGRTYATRDSTMVIDGVLYAENWIMPQYHSNWNDLIPVCQHINKMKIVTVEMNGIDSVVPWVMQCRTMRHGAVRFDIDETYKGTIQFIEWYNEITNNLK